MVDEPDNIVLRYLRQMDAKLDRVIDDVSEVKTRVGILKQRTPRCPAELTALSTGWIASKSVSRWSTLRSDKYPPAI